MRRRFNWAAVLQPRIHADADATRCHRPRASIGPRSFNRGYHGESRILGDRDAGLQLGRGPSTADTAGTEHHPTTPRQSFNWAAVLQPRILVRVRETVGVLLRASIGPRSFNRGYGWWSLHNTKPLTELQLGRGPSTADTEHTDGLTKAIAGASIGPRSFNRGYAEGLVTPY